MPQEFPYSDILDMPHHVSRKHPQMSMRDRAAQFSPFAALEGHGEAIEETARHTEERRELDEDERARLDVLLRELAARIDERPRIAVEHFVADRRKSGGAYVRTIGRLVEISVQTGTLRLEHGEKIDAKDIAAIRVC